MTPGLWKLNTNYVVQCFATLFQTCSTDDFHETNTGLHKVMIVLIWYLEFYRNNVL